jgi:hypothetical protein
MASATIKYNIHSYADAVVVLKDRYRKKIGNNTWLINYTKDTAVVKFHDTIIAVFTPRFSTFYADGWQTYTTCDRINQLIPEGWRLYQSKRQWYLWHSQGDVILPWREGFTFLTNQDRSG